MYVLHVGMGWVALISVLVELVLIDELFVFKGIMS